jgi:hypothetical protein
MQIASGGQFFILPRMSIEEIRTLKHAQPFRPFDIVTKNGRTVHIEEPIRIALSPTGDSVAGFGRDGSFYLPLVEIATVRPGRKRRKKAL